MVGGLQLEMGGVRRLVQTLRNPLWPKPQYLGCGPISFL